MSGKNLASVPKKMKERHVDLVNKRLIATLQQHNKQFTGYQSLLRKYGSNPEYMKFFAKLQMERGTDGRISFILGDKKYSLIPYSAKEQSNANMMSDDDTVNFLKQFPWEAVNGEQESYLSEEFKWQEFNSDAELAEANRKAFQYNRMDLGNKVFALAELLEVGYNGTWDDKAKKQTRQWERGSLYIAEGMGGHYMEEMWRRKPKPGEEKFPRAWISQVMEDPTEQLVLVYEDIT